MITVSGEATFGGAGSGRDRGRLTSDARTAREASEANNAAMGKLLLALKAANIDEKDIQTSRVSLQPQYRAEPLRTVARRRLPRAAIASPSDCTTSRRSRAPSTFWWARARPICGGVGFSVSNASNFWMTPAVRRRRCPPQGRDLRQGRRRHARRAARHLRARHAWSDAFRARWPGAWRRPQRRSRRAKRRCR